MGQHVEIIKDSIVARAEEIITKITGQRASVDVGRGYSFVSGENRNVGSAYEDLWIPGGIEVLPSSNDIDTISSSDAGDTQVLLITGYTNTSGIITRVIQNATLNGQNKVVLDTPLYRIEKFINVGSVDFLGDVYAYEESAITNGVPQVSDKIHLQSLPENGNKGTKLNSIVPTGEYLVITGVTASVFRDGSLKNAEFDFKIKEPGGVFISTFKSATSSSQGTIQVSPNAPFILGPGTEFSMKAFASGSGTIVGGTMVGAVAKLL